MANLNKVMLIGRLTFDPEPTQNNPNGATFRFAVNNRKQNKVTQEWEDAPCYIEVEIWNRGENRQAERALKDLRKGSQIYIEGHLKYDEWEDRNGGGKRSKLVVVAESFQYLDTKEEAERRRAGPPSPRPRGGQQQSGPARGNGGSSRSSGGYSGPSEDDYDSPPMGAPAAGGRGGAAPDPDDIPF
jgi:single-strand DNA-binding protein